MQEGVSFAEITVPEQFFLLLPQVGLTDQELCRTVNMICSIPAFPCPPIEVMQNSLFPVQPFISKYYKI